MLKALKMRSVGLEIFLPGLKGPSSFLLPVLPVKEGEHQPR